ncbi:hypothetical protein CCACVL1_25882 [Corchorus capsularis]|uniref:RNase H type-1 domain-containing protein n=1 Tax=Corchorus capsularis TaxID=210143 RepID=A0A1R3GGQ9_COCAP|nr:hypothetical protein CCACVL1_25882 [Corchorus capsularis]
MIGFILSKGFVDQTFGYFNYNLVELKLSTVSPLKDKVLRVNEEVELEMEMELLKFSKFKLQLRALLAEFRDLRDRERSASEQIHLLIQKQKQTEEEYNRKLQELRAELAACNESQQKLERKVNYLQNDNVLLENKQKELQGTIQSLLQSKESFVNAYQESTCEMKWAIEARDRKLALLSEKVNSHLLLFDSIEKEAFSIKQVVDHVKRIALHFEVRSLSSIIQRIQNVVANRNEEDRRVISLMLDDKEECEMITQKADEWIQDRIRLSAEQSPNKACGMDAADNRGIDFTFTTTARYQCTNLIQSAQPPRQKHPKIQDGLKLAVDRNITKLEVFVDAKVMIDLIHNANADLHPIGTLIIDCRSLMKQTTCLKLVHCYREANTLADALANFGRLSDDNFSVFNHIPNSIFDVFMDDVMGLSFPRTTNS